MSRLDSLERACGRSDARAPGLRVQVNLDPGDIVATTEELRRLIAAVRAAIRVAYAVDLMGPGGFSAEGDLRAALKPFLDGEEKR